MFWNKKKATPTPSAPQMIMDKNGKICGVNTINGTYSIKAYNGIMMGSPNQTVFYVYNNLGDKVAWDIKTVDELNMVINNLSQPKKV